MAEVMKFEDFKEHGSENGAKVCTLIFYVLSQLSILRTKRWQSPRRLWPQVQYSWRSFQYYPFSSVTDNYLSLKFIEIKLFDNFLTGGR